MNYINVRQLQRLSSKQLEALLVDGQLTVVCNSRPLCHISPIDNSLLKRQATKPSQIASQENEGELIENAILDKEAFNGKITEEELEKWAQIP
jgi:hypothetical protein